jgi:hypothetical protein
MYPPGKMYFLIHALGGELGKYAENPRNGS